MARTTNAVKHTHQYYRERMDGLWHCSGIDGCTHYMPKNMPQPAGRQSICWSCNKSFQLAPYNMVDDKPTCDTCSEQLDVINQVLEEKMPTVKQTGLAAFGAKTKTMADVEKDEIEVIPEDETHSPECEVYATGECTCR